MSSFSNRNANLDVLRILSLLCIVVYHVVQRWPSRVTPFIAELTSYGQYGVDVFFSLSGWLVGQNLVNKRAPDSAFTILINRLARIYPTYLAALVVAFVGVSVARGQRFDYFYFLLAQNYRLQIPFFFVSWFLCVLAQFYVLIFFLQFFLKGNLKLICLVTSFLFLLCIGFRIILVQSGVINNGLPFGCYFTAFHLRADTILLSFLAALSLPLISELVHRFKALSRYIAIALIAPLAIFWLCLAYFKNEHFNAFYILNPLLLAVLCTCLVAYSSALPPLRVRSFQPAFAFAVGSLYSVYLTHPFAIEAFERLPVKGLPDLVKAVIVTIMILLTGFLFRLCLDSITDRIAAPVLLLIPCQKHRKTST